MTNQPKWKCIAQLGDINPIDHGGAWVLVDTTGVYDPEMEILEVIEMDGDHVLRQSATVLLERCTYQNGVLSDNEFHPDLPAWFADDIESVCLSMGYRGKVELIEMLCSDDPAKLAMGYRDLVDYFGIDNFGGYDITDWTRSGARKRYSRAMYKIR